MKSVPAGKLITIQEIRAILAERHGATIGCPLTTGIFAWIAAHAAEDDRDAKRRRCHAVLADAQVRRLLEREVSRRRRWRSKAKLEAEGHAVIERGKRFAVEDYESRSRSRTRAIDERRRRIGESIRSASRTWFWRARRPTGVRCSNGWVCPFRCRAPHVRRVASEGRGVEPAPLAERLAHAKAASLVADEPGATIIGCDQVVSFEGQIFGKPSTDGTCDRPARCAGRPDARADHRAGGDPRRADPSPHGRDHAADAAAAREPRSSATSRRTSRSTVPAATSSSRRGSPCSSGSNPTTTRRSRACR